MRVAVLADIHGNLRALDAVLERLGRDPVDCVIVAGDVVNLLPHSRACWQRVRSLGCRLLRGNHERYLFDYGTSAAPPEWGQPWFDGLKWQRAQFSASELAEMRALPLSFEQDSVLFTHASPVSDRALLRDLRDDQLAELFPDLNAHLVVRGHEHLPAVRTWRGKTIVTGGALGLPLSGTGEAFYLVLELTKSEIRYRRKSAPYDRQGALADMNEDFLAQIGPMGRIFKLELETVRPHAVPFFRHYGAALNRGELSLGKAVAAYTRQVTG